jgi:hypothetical protein
LVFLGYRLCLCGIFVVWQSFTDSAGPAWMNENRTRPSIGQPLCNLRLRLHCCSFCWRCVVFQSCKSGSILVSSVLSWLKARVRNVVTDPHGASIDGLRLQKCLKAL